MELTDIIMNSITYPSKNIKALAIYLLLGIIVGVVAFATGASTVTASVLTGAKHGINGAGIIVFIIGLVILFALSCLIGGYGLDIIKLGIRRSEDAPGIEFERQVSNGLKNVIVGIVYLIVPTIITILLSWVFRGWVTYLIALILYVVFAFALMMAQCRLAETDDLSYALNIQGAISDIQLIGMSKVIITIIAVFLVEFVITFIVMGVFSLFGSRILTSMVTSLVSIYLVFFSNRAIGLLYSER